MFSSDKDLVVDVFDGFPIRFHEPLLYFHVWHWTIFEYENYLISINTRSYVKFSFVLWIWFSILLLISVIDTIRLVYELFLRRSCEIYTRSTTKKIIDTFFELFRLITFSSWNFSRLTRVHEWSPRYSKIYFNAFVTNVQNKKFRKTEIADIRRTRLR